MKFLERYLAKTVIMSILLVLLVLAGLQVFILFVNQLGDIGKGDYNLFAALSFVMFEMPYEVYLFFPMASLIGCLMGLGTLANHRELLVMRASGMSILQVTLAIFKAAVVLILVVTLCGEVFLPTLVHHARDQKGLALSGGQSLRTARGLWLREGNDFISVANVVSGKQLQDIYQYHFDADHNLAFARTIKMAQYSDHQWYANDVNETKLYSDSSESIHHDHMRWDVSLQPSIMNVSQRDPDEMTLVELYHYLHVQTLNHQVAQNYQFIFWQRLVHPLTTLVMMILAIPFIFGPLRSSTMGSKLLLGATVGFGFYILNRFLGSLSQIYQLSAMLSALGPTCFFALVGIYAMKKTTV